jgi:HD-GYP domain-containing protein (c-di-GMP phosphodiesterase class II)
MRIRFRVSLTVSILIFVGSLLLSFYLHIHSISGKASIASAEHFFNAAFKTIEQSTNGLINHSFESAYLVAGLEDVRIDESNIMASPPLRTIFGLLQRDRELYSIYIGYKDSRFIQLISVNNDPLILKAHMAPTGTMWILRTIELIDGAKRVQNWSFLDENFQVISTKSENNPEYDPRNRPWYLTTRKAGEAALSDVYMFNSLHELGITVSEKKANGMGIVGVDLTLRQLNNIVSGMKISKNSRVLIIDKNYRVIAKPETMKNIGLLEKLSNSSDPLLSELSINHTLGLQQIKIGDEVYYAKTSDAFKQGSTFKVIVTAPMSDFNTHFVNIQDLLNYTAVIWLILFFPATYFFSKHMSSRLSVIALEAEKIGDLVFECKERKLSRIFELYLLEKNFDAMRSSLLGKTQDLEISQLKLNRLVELGISFSAERNSEKLMEMVLLGAKELTNADGGSLYKLEDDTLSFKIIRNDTLGIAAGGTQNDEITLNPIPLYDDAGNENHHNVVSHSIWETKSILIEDAYDSENFEFLGPKAFDQINDYHSKSFLTIPLMPRGAKPIGALQLINCKDEDGNVTAFSEESLRFVEALGAQAATILYNLELLEAQKNLMDSMIQLIAGAIDAKSLYTGGHCKRVPELAIMIAEEACMRTDGIFTDFAFQNEDEWREFSIGAWLHDCGKVVTPEYVIDKATKLETIYNRIHEIRTRFEVLLRDAEVDYYKGLSEGGDKVKLAKDYDARKQDLIEKFASVAECNEGGEFMDDNKIERLKKIAEEEWVRNFDIRLGLSHEEEPLYQECDTLPAREKLLADQAYHILEHNRDIKQQYTSLDFKLPVPENLYNRGEIYNLSVKRGTLTAEERFKINEHIMQTIAMLGNMPFPPELARVPEYAGAHHETMIGTGYPRQLDASKLSIPAQIMAVADIFEALTASDRPYKKAKPLSEAIKILSFFKKDQHINPEIFDLLLTSGVYKKYAEQFLLPEQIDEVNIFQYLS